MLERCTLQPGVAGTAGGGEGATVLGVSIVVAALLHQDLGGLDKSSDLIAVLTDRGIDDGCLTGRGEGWVELTGVHSRFGRFHHGGLCRSPIDIYERVGVAGVDRLS